MRVKAAAVARHPDVLGAALAASLAAAVAAVSLRVWEWRPGIPLSIIGDSPLVLTQLDDIITNGWFWSNSAIGFPLGQQASFFPELDVIHVLGVKALAVLGGDAATVGALYFFIGFPLIAVTTYLLCRSEHLALPASVVVAVLFAVAPYHQERFEHLWLASYWTVPIALWLVLAVARGTTPFDPGGSTSRTGWGLTVLGLTLVGLSGAYYAGFTLLLMLAALFLRAGAGRPHGWWRGGLASIAVLGSVAAVPLVVARIGMAGTMRTGPRPATRSPMESERYAGRLIDLALPWEGHRVDALASLTRTYQAAGRPVVETVALGVVGLVGATALLVIGLRQLTLRRTAPPRLTMWAALLVVTGVFYTAGGLGSVVALLATPQLRTWSRLSLVVLLLGLLAVGHWLSRPRRRPTALALAAAVLLVGALDQTNPGRAPEYAGIQQRVTDLRTYTDALASVTQPGCGVLQLPVMRFPEGTLPRGYDSNAQLLPHLTTRRLAWSHGGMSGTQAGDWLQGIDLAEPDRLQRELRAAGFCAVEVDTAGVALDTPAVVALTGRLGEPVATTSDGRLVAWSLAGTPAGTPADAARLLEPVVVGMSSGPVMVDGAEVYQDSGPTSAFTTSNLSTTDAVAIRISADVTSLGSPSREVVVRDGNRVLARARVNESTPTRLSFDMTAPPGFKRLEVTISGDPVRDSGLRSVSARFATVTVTSASSAHVASTQDQAQTGVVIR